MVGDGKIQCLSAPINIGPNNSDQSGNYLNASSAPSTAVIDSITESSATSTGLGGGHDSVSVSKQSQPTSRMTSPINLFFNRDSGDQGQRALSLTNTTSDHDGNSKDGNDSDSSEVNKGSTILHYQIPFVLHCFRKKSSSQERTLFKKLQMA